MPEDDRETSGRPRLPYNGGGLELLFERQLALQVHSYGADPSKLEGPNRGQYVTYNHTALIKELGEALDEIAWKPWSVDQTTFNREAYLKELVDAFHLWMNLVLVAKRDGQTVGDLAFGIMRRYFDKADINAERMASGLYDAISSKCECGREIRDGERKSGLDQYTFEGTDSRLTRMAYLCPCSKLNFHEVAP